MKYQILKKVKRKAWQLRKRLTNLQISIKS
jgi:hypothetical protein